MYHTLMIAGVKRSYSINQNTRQRVFDLLTGEVVKVPEIIFAYVYGSILDSTSVHDVDVGLYLDDSELSRQAEILDTLTDRVVAAVALPVDVRLLNAAPVSFLFHVFRGRLLLSRDEELLTDLLENVPRQYLDIAPLLRQATKEAFSP